MNRLTEHDRQHTTHAKARHSKPLRWRVGDASVSTEELQAWQLGPARIDRWLDARPPLQDD
ncbi:MAG TPA: hypothetical protein VHP37_30335 [Burkholderiales bacterium]|nr:hypothetical protein [Burkholderiales bacterium]